MDDQRCGYKTCGEFARAVALGKAPCYGCVSGGPEVAADVCKIMGVKAPEQAVPQFNPGTEFHPSRFGGTWGIGRMMGWGIGRGRFTRPGRGRGRGNRLGLGRRRR